MKLKLVGSKTLTFVLCFVLLPGIVWGGVPRGNNVLFGSKVFPTATTTTTTTTTTISPPTTLSSFPYNHTNDFQAVYLQHNTNVSNLNISVYNISEDLYYYQEFTNSNNASGTYYLENFTSFINEAFWYQAKDIDTLDIIEPYTKARFGGGSFNDTYIKGNLIVTGNINVSGCINYNGGTLGVCI